MKLVDLLVQEFPKRGGWPEGVDAVEQDSEGQLFEMESDYCSDFKLKKCDDWIADMVTKQQYQSALAASQKVEWDGESVPPVGAKCEIIINEGDLGLCEILFVGASLLVWRQESTYQEGSGYHRHMNFRPLRTEAERKRDDAKKAISELRDIDGYKLAACMIDPIYDAIAAGKIPGVKLEY